jgi:hypothetical protein
MNYLYSINVNVAFCLKHSLWFEHYSLLYLIARTYTRAENMSYDWKLYFRLNMVKIHSELPMLSEKDDTVYRYIKTLIEKWLIKKVPKLDYYCLTEEWNLYDKAWSDQSEKNPIPIGKKSESEKFPTYNNTNNSTLNKSQKSEDKKSEDENTNDKKSIKDDLEKTFDLFLEMRKKIKKPLTDFGITLVRKELNKLSKEKEEQIKILEQSIMRNYSWVFPLNKDNQYSKPPVKKEYVDPTEAYWF